jgi:hypothetical protein
MHLFCDLSSQYGDGNGFSRLICVCVLSLWWLNRAEIWHANFKHGIAEGGGGGGDELVVGGEEFGVQWGRRERSRERNNHLWLNTTAVFSNNNRAYYKPHQ